jgi:ATP-dependent Zn protease
VTGTFAGVAAEAMVYGRKGKRTHATSDFQRALERAKQIGSHPHPAAWKPTGSATIDFRKIFVSPQPSDDVVRTLETAYRMAKHVIQSHGGNYYRVVSLLLARRTTSDTDRAIEIVLGTRAPHNILSHFGPKFLLPHRKR